MNSLSSYLANLQSYTIQTDLTVGYLHRYVLIMWKYSTDQMISNRNFERNDNEAVYVTKSHFGTGWLNMFSCVSSHDLLV